MATSQAEAELAERRVRPLYDAIDNGQNKKAVQMADKILRKQEDLHCAKALKGIAILRMGRQEEAVALLNQVVEARPVDQASLQAVTLFYKETGDYRKIAELYSAAAEKYPRSGEILTHLFMAYVRVGDYQKQQQIAAALSKAYPANGPYYCWRIMSILMQAQEAKDESLVKNMYLPLAERLIEKYVNEGRVEAEAEVKLYLMILSRLGKRKKKLEVLHSPLAAKFRSEDERHRVEVECLMGMKKWNMVSEKLTGLLHKRPDEWSYLVAYISAQIRRSLRTKRKKERESKAKTEKGAEMGDEPEEKAEEGRESQEGEGKTEDEDDEEKEPQTESTAVSEGNQAATEAAKDCRTGDEEQESAILPGGGATEGEEMGTKTSEEPEDQDGPSSSEELETERGLIRIGGCEGASAADSWLLPLLEARDFIDYLLGEERRKLRETASERKYVYRGPYLARMELLKQLTNFKLDEAIELNTPFQMLVDYFEVFGTKNCCYDDLQVYIRFLPEEDIKKFLEHVQGVVERPDFDCEDDQIRENVSRLRKFITMIQLQRFCGLHKPLTVSDRQKLVDQCKMYYWEGLKLGRDLTPTVRQHSDFFAILATHLKMELFQETGDCSHLWSAIFLLEYAKKSNPQISLLLMKLYGFLGATEFLTDLYDELYVKHVQIETLGYLLLHYLQSAGTFGFAGQLYRSGLRFYYNCSKEIGEYVIQAYKNGMFQKIVEFVGLRDRFSRSLNFASILVDMSLMELVSSVDSIPKAKELFAKEWLLGLPFSSASLQDYCARLVDSRDLKALDDWSPSVQRLSDIEIKISFDLERLWLKIRITLVQCLRDAIGLLPGGTPGGKGGAAGDARASFTTRVVEYCKLLDLLNEHIGVAVLKQRKELLLPVQSPPPCLGYMFARKSYSKVMRSMLAIVECVAMGTASIEHQLKEVLGVLEGAKSQIDGVPEELRDSVIKLASEVKGDPSEGLDTPPTEHPYTILRRTRIDVESYVMFVQVVSHVILLTAVCAGITNPVTSGDSRRKKKKKKPPETNLLGRELIAFLKEVKSQLVAVSHQFLPLPSLEGDLVDQLNKLYISEPETSFEDGVAPRVCKGALESYNMSFKDCAEVVRGKIDFVSTVIQQLGGTAY